MPNAVDPDSFDSMEYLEYLRTRWKFSAAAVLIAAAVAVAVCLILPQQYTATATLVIEPPGADPRTATAVSPVYLESLKSYESFADSDSLFVKACEKFGLLKGSSAPSVESFKRRVLRVDKLKDTKLLNIAVTLPNPIQAQAMVQFLAEETVALNRSMARAGDSEALGDVQRQVDAAEKQVETSRAEASAAAVAGSEPVLETEAQSLADLKARAEAQRIEANVALADAAARGDQESAATARARLTALTADEAALDKQLQSKSTALSQLRARRQRTDDQLRTAEDVFTAARLRSDGTRDATRFRSEELRIVDPGIVPQRPSFPNLPLTVIAAVAMSIVACLVCLTFQFGFARQREQPVRAGLRVAGGGR